MEGVYEVWKATFGEEHHRTAYAMHFWACALGGLGDYAGMRSWLEKVVPIRALQFGPDGKLTLSTKMAVLAIPVEHDEGVVLSGENAEEALRVVRVMESDPQLGPNAVPTAVARGIAALLCSANGDRDEALHQSTMALESEKAAKLSSSCLADIEGIVELVSETSQSITSQTRMIAAAMRRIQRPW